jgi:hypothetical protein
MVMFASGYVLASYVEEDVMCAPGSSVFGPLYTTYEWCTFDLNFLAATQMTVETYLTNSEFDGILGLALPGMSVGEGYSMLDRWKEEGFKGFRLDMVQKKLFVVNDTQEGWPRATEAIVIGKSDWKIQVDGLKVWQTLSEPVLAIVDSGSSYITVPRVIY